MKVYSKFSSSYNVQKLRCRPPTPNIQNLLQHDTKLLEHYTVHNLCIEVSGEHIY